MGAEYPWAFSADRSLHEACGVKGIPHAAIIDPDGTILWTGSPYRLNQKALKQAMRGASKHLTFGWGEEFEPIAKLVVEGQFGKALAGIEKLAARGTDGAAKVRGSVMAKLDARIDAMNKAHAKGDFLASLEIAESLEKQLRKLEQVDAVRAVIKAIESDTSAKRVLEGQRALARVVGGNLEKSKQVDAAVKKAERLAKKYPGTIVEAHAEEFVRRMKARKAMKR